MPDRPVWYFDLVSPFVFLQLEQRGELFVRLQPVCRPVLFGALLKEHGSLGPVEIPGKRTFTYRFVQWQAQQHGIVMHCPPKHPFNPLALQRLCVHLGDDWGRIRELSRFVWQEGRVPESDSDWQDVGKRIGLGVNNIQEITQNPEVKQRLADYTTEALQHQVFGVPTFRVGSELFWGVDATGMLEAFLADPSLFKREEYRYLEQVEFGVRRQP
jgi:2-hydroxychromene-2-carboxylate isomerase